MKLSHIEEEAHWISLYHSGDESALAYFFDLHYRSLCYFANKMVQDADEAKDIVSGCFIRFWEGEHKAQSVQSIKSFLYISCRNACLNYLKQLGTRTRIQHEYYQNIEEADNSLDYAIIRSEVLQILSLEIDNLPEKCRTVFKLIYFDQKKTDEIAEIIGSNEKSVRYFKAKAIELLKTAMLKKGLSDSLYLSLLLLLNRP